MTDTTLYFASLSEIAQALNTKKTTSLALTTEYLNRLETLGPTLGTVARVTRELALTQAKTADAERENGDVRSPLHGIPFGVKDLLATAKIPTEWGSRAHAGQIFNYDAAVVEKLQTAGAVLIGKLSMMALAGGGGYRYATASSTGPARTPWNSDHWAGGSSSGPGAATAAGLVGFSIGSETWGSIVCPASFCGVVGLRPTFGRVSRYGAMALSWTMDKIGPMARTVNDCALILEAIAGPDPRDTTTIGAQPFRASKPRSIKGLKLGIIRPTYKSSEKAQPETESVFEAALALLSRLGATLTNAEIPNLPVEEAASTIINVEGSAAFEGVIRDSKRFEKLGDPEQQGGLLAGLVIPGVDYVRSQRIHTLAQRAASDLFTRYDALVAPGMLQVAPPIAENLDTYFVGSDEKISGFGNLTGLPALCLPMGYGQNNLPLGLQFVGGPNSEALLLSLGSAYEKATEWHTHRPPAPFG